MLFRSGWRDGSAVPAGAGLVTPTTPMGEPLDVPRSSNRRVLPTTNEPGVWAADGPPSDTAPPGLLGLSLPLGHEVTGWEGRRRTQLCGDSMDALLRRIGLYPRAMALPDGVRSCLAAQLFRVCALGYEASYRDSAKSDSSKERTYRLYKRMTEAADTWLDTACKGPRSVEAEAIFAQAAGQRLKDRQEVR